MLTPAQLVDVRRFMGFSVSGNASFAGYRELVYSDVSYMGLSIETRLANISAEEELQLTTYYLPKLQSLLNAITDATKNLGTDVAAVWTRNKDEIPDRVSLYNWLRRDLCHFLGFPPGAGIPRGGSVIRG